MKDEYISVEHILLGSDLEAMDRKQLEAEVERTRCLPSCLRTRRPGWWKPFRQKAIRWVSWGMGSMDAPALKMADIGISVDSAVDVAKESADIILLEKSLMVLEEGSWRAGKLMPT